MIPGLDLFNQFILWKPEHRADGKTDKIPCDQFGWKINHTDPRAWHDPEEARRLAAAAAPHLRIGVGFVFTAQDPFFFIDIDHAWEGDAWSATATDIFRRFPGCAMERSQSGAGAHIFGVGTPSGEFRKKNQALGLELYTSGRFVALTGAGLVGNALTDAQTALDGLVADYFAPQDPEAEAAAPVGWGKGPDPGWGGPEDDAELIRRLVASRSAGALFGDRAAAADLWAGNAEALARVYPSGTGQPWDASSADLALCLHLAYWTGRDPDRIERLFNQSGLVRGKWSERADYRRRTIERACQLTTRIATATTAPEGTPTETAAANTAAPGGPVATAGARSGIQILTIAQQMDHFNGCVYIRDAHRVYTPDGALLKPEQFRATYGGYTFIMDGQNDRTSRNAFEAFTENQGAFFQRAHNLCFRPEVAPGAVIEEEGRIMVNTYAPIQTPRQAGDPAPFLDHLARILPDPRDRQILLAYLAALVQYPGVKFQWAPLLQGMEGNGKSLIIRCISKAVGTRYTHLPNAGDIHNKFNAWIEGMLFIGVEEVYTQDRQEALESLKPLITNDRVEVQGKGLDQRTGDNRANFILCSNHKDAIRKTATDRRYCVFYTAQQSPGDLERDGLTGDYFPRIYAWLRREGYAIVNDYLRTYPIPDALNPATLAHRAPETSSTAEALAVNLGGIEQEIHEAIGENLQGFRGGWISTTALGNLLEARRSGRKVNPVRRRDILGSLGYIPHPGLPGGRSTIDIGPERGRPILYIRPGAPGSEAHGLDAVRAYEVAQGYPTM